MKKILVAFGTRPEIIKLTPVMHELKSSDFDVITLHTGQHNQLAEEMLQLFRIEPNYDLKSMGTTSDLFELTEFLLPKIKQLLYTVKPDSVIVQGDTTSAFLCALAAFYLKIPVYHVEAGLRSFDIYNPFPEEVNRKQISGIASAHFAPTSQAKQNLLNEGVDPSVIFETGNTVIDALYKIKELKQYANSVPEILREIPEEEKLILVTAHRRENHGEPLEQIMSALVEILDQHEQLLILFPAHPSPAVQEIVHLEDYKHPRLKVIQPLSYLSFHHVLDRCDVILTDSGGIQEEAAALGKTLLVLREKTERQELIESGFTKLLGSDKKLIVKETLKVLASGISRQKFNPYGNGDASKKIVHLIKNQL